MLKKSILIQYLIANSLLERYLSENSFGIYHDFGIWKEKSVPNQPYRLKILESRNFQVLTKRRYFFSNPLSNVRREENFEYFLEKKFKITLDLDLESEDIYTFTPYEDLENLLRGINQTVGCLNYGLPKFFFEAKNLGKHPLPNLDLFFTNQNDFANLERFPTFRLPESFFLKKFLAKDFHYKLEPELMELQDLSAEPKFYRYYKSKFYGFRKYPISEYNIIQKDYRTVFFQPMVIIYKTINLEVPEILQLGSEFPVTYSKFRVSAKKKFLNTYTPLFWDPLFINNLYFEGGLPALAIISAMLYRKQVFSVKPKHETYFYQDEFKNEELYKSYSKQQFSLFNAIRSNTKKLYTLHETFGYKWKHNIIYKMGDIKLSENIKVPCVFFSATRKKEIQKNILKQPLIFNKHDWVFTLMFYETLFRIQTYLIIRILWKKHTIYKSLNFLLFLPHEEEDTPDSQENFVAFLTLKTSLWDKRYFIKHILLKNGINRDLYKFYRLSVKTLMSSGRHYDRFLFKKITLLKNQNTDITRISPRNWLTSDVSFVGSKCESRKFYSQVARMTPWRAEMVIFTKKEKQRIHKNIQAKNAFFGFGREGLANNANYRYSESLASSFVKKILHNLKLPSLKNKKKSLFSFFKEIHYNLFTISYIFFNMKTTVRDTRTKPYLPYFGVNFLSSILPYFHGYPTIKKKIRGSNPIYFSSMKSYTGFLFEDILKSMLNLNNTSHLLLILKNSNFFFNRKKVIYPTVDTVTKRFLNEFSKIEDWYPSSTSSIPYTGANYYFSTFKPNKLVKTRPINILEKNILEKNISFFLNLFTNKPLKRSEKKRKYPSTTLRKIRNLVFLKDPGKRIILLNQGSHMPDFMTYFRSKKEPYYALNVRSNSAKEAISFKYQTYRVKQFMKLAYDETEEIQEDYSTILRKTGLKYRNKKHYAWYCLSAIEDNIYYWSTLELRKSLGESLEREKYRSNQGNLWMQKMLQSNPTMSKRQIAAQQIFASSLDAFEEKYIEYNKNFFLGHLYSDYDLDENEF